jgi:hypothetical protein
MPLRAARGCLEIDRAARALNQLIQEVAAHPLEAITNKTAFKLA